MDTRTQDNSNNIALQRLETILSFDFNTVIAVTENKTVYQAVLSAKAVLDAWLDQSGLLPVSLKNLCRQVTIYYLLCLNDQKTAEKYASAYLALTAPDSLEHAEALTFKGYADVLDPRQSASDHLITALKIYSRLGLRTPGHQDILAGQAFACRCLALIQLRSSDGKSALESIQNAVLIDQKLCESHPGMRGALAISFHIQGDIYTVLHKKHFAFLAYLHALEIRKNLYEEENDIVVVTRDAAEQTLRAIVDTGSLGGLIGFFNRDFTFDWNACDTITPSGINIDKAVLFASLTSRYIDRLAPADQMTFAQLLLKLGSYCIHIKRDPDLALSLLYLAEKLAAGQEQAWIWNHIAFCYQQQLANSASVNPSESEMKHLYKQVYRLVHSILITYSDQSSPSEIRILAFARCVEALIYYEASRFYARLPDQSTVNINEVISGYLSAAGSFQHALALYARIDAKDTQYMRALNRLAMIQVETAGLMARHGMNEQAVSVRQEAMAAFDELETFWSVSSAEKSIYAARFYMNYGEFLACSSDIDELSHAATLYRMAIAGFASQEGEKKRLADATAKAVNLQDKIALLQTHTRRTHVFFKACETNHPPRMPPPVSTLAYQP
ncbi:hypothetical protein AQUSIP_19170 [Aquicella siphonis]|uniref:Uncharacterized protein n=1 Tax=Aquicella siphonis TaxID=254247 RepID=A0A5E4PJ45_9COXI|nr:hypothetical protein [Aquicella siphonis]VVC76595.1 hypothetical protein AQUSIP_19170 [Aquicella siphonis]